MDKDKSSLLAKSKISAIIMVSIAAVSMWITAFLIPSGAEVVYQPQPVVWTVIGIGMAVGVASAVV